jgi:hypothetical protein
MMHDFGDHALLYRPELFPQTADLDRIRKTIDQQDDDLSLARRRSVQEDLSVPLQVLDSQIQETLRKSWNSAGWRLLYGCHGPSPSFPRYALF